MKWYFEDFIYGSIDGSVTTFAVVQGSILDPLTIRIKCKFRKLIRRVIYHTHPNFAHPNLAVMANILIRKIFTAT